MNEASPSTKPTILVAPLDWGLGHSTRCIPIIHKLITCGCRVILAGEGNSQVILRSEFPELLFLPLQGYRIRYASRSWSMKFSIAAQLPKMLKAIKRENRWLQQVVQQHAINAVISDNRYGLHHPKIYSVFLTHQLQIKSGWAAAADMLLRKLHYRFVQRFQECWVPDNAETLNVSGTLSHPQQMPLVPVRYLGLLSRFTTGNHDELEQYILVLLSGPEPQRSIWEQQLLEQAKAYNKPVLFVRGLPAQTSVPSVPYHITIVNHLPTQTLQKAIAGAIYVVARTGYSTVMELLLLKKKCILIPTPGQTEQEYLAQHLIQTQQALCIAQKKFQLKNAVSLAEAFPYRKPHYENGNGLDAAVQSLLKLYKAGIDDG